MEMVSGVKAERMTWLLSVTMIDLVLFPCVASMSRELFFASSLNLFMGADLGVRTATTLEMATMFP